MYILFVLCTVALALAPHLALDFPLATCQLLIIRTLATLSDREPSSLMRPARISFYGHPLAPHSSVHKLVRGGKPLKVGSLLQLATAALSQKLDAAWQTSTKASHVVLCINSGCDALQPGHEL